MSSTPQVRFALVAALSAAIWIAIPNALLGAEGTDGTADDVFWPSRGWPRAAPADLGLDEAKLLEARDYALTQEGSGLVVRGGRAILSWGDQAQRYDLKSTSKSIGVTALGLALKDGKMRLDDRASAHHPSLGIPPEENRAGGWIEQITIRHLATQTAGFEKPGGYGKLLFEPGTRWRYSDAGPNWLAECITLAYRRDVRDLLFERVFAPLGIEPAQLAWRKNAYRPAEIEGIPRREFGSGVSASVDAMARIGLLYLRRGRWRGEEVLPASFVDAAGSAVPAVVGLPVDLPEEYGSASSHYGLLWWNNADGKVPGAPRDAYWSWGLYDSLIVVFPSLDLVVARAGKSWERKKGADHYDVLRPFLEPIALAAGWAPIPSSSPALAAVDWAPASSIRRAARGSDNWPLAWADDDHLYTAYGDGWGFDPRVPVKLSLGLARIEGPPDAFVGANIRSPTLEQLGDGPSGKKASGLLMVDGVLYLWARNAGSAQLAWSRDRGATWSWSDWRLRGTFGCPAFVHFGRNYEGARDGFVYVASPDAPDAYTPADRMVLARVPKERLLERAAYEFFAGVASEGRPRWSGRIEDRAAVMAVPGRCYRSGITYVAGIGRYLWAHVLPASVAAKGAAARGVADQEAAGEDRGVRKGSLTIFDAPEPWGPWTTAYHAEEWDVDPGETASFPPKWIDPDGLTLHLVFSGDDAFCVRRATLRRRSPRRSRRCDPRRLPCRSRAPWCVRRRNGLRLRASSPLGTPG